VTDMVAPSPAARDAFDALHATIDPSHVRCLLETELADLVTSVLGDAVVAVSSSSGTLAIDDMLTEVADRPAVLAALRAELRDGRQTGFHAAVEDGRLMATFSSATVSATRR
jgi:hypothetical protein